MNDADHLKRLISIYRQGLQIRQEQLARAGSTPDPSIILDIERLETTITELQQELKAVPGSDDVAPDKTWSRGYRYLKAEYSYRFSPDDIRRQEFRSKVQLEALRDGVDIIKDRYSWTGGGEQSAPVTRHHRYVVFHPSVEMNGSQYYYTHLGGEMVRGQKKEVSHYIDLFDQQRSFNSFFNRSVAIETLSLTLKVIIPEKYADTLREINFRTIDLGEDRTIALKRLIMTRAAALLPGLKMIHSRGDSTPSNGIGITNAISNQTKAPPDPVMLRRGLGYAYQRRLR
ncbi:MAG: hypothetical protein HC875_32405 [Anaerolineales bacterium]|nr:hypothetical protein [Anaerolineales bacterium]